MLSEDRFATKGDIGSVRAEIAALRAEFVRLQARVDARLVAIAVSVMTGMVVLTAVVLFMALFIK